MKFAFTEDQRQIQEAVRGALEAECKPTRVRAAWETRDEGLRSVLAELGVLGLNIPEDAGGMGLGALDWVLPLEVCGRYAVPLPLIETIATNPTLVQMGRADLAEAVAAGEAFVTLVAPGGYAVDADLADLILTVDGDRVGVVTEPTLTPQRSVDGSRRLFRVDGAVTPVEADGAALADRAALAAAAQLVGLSRFMLDVGTDYVKARRQFGKPIGSFQAVQHRLVNALLKLRFAAPSVYRAAWSVDTEDAEASAHVSLAKLVASEAATFTAEQVLQVHGAIGYTFEHDLHLWMKRAWALSNTWGDVRHHTDRLATHLLEA